MWICDCGNPVGLAAATDAQAQAVKIGYPRHDVGPRRAVGIDSVDGFQARATQARRQIRRNAVELVVVDDQLKPEIASSR